MFTLEESALLKRMLWVIAIAVCGLAVAAACYLALR
jgi:hypothetical protein